MLQLNVRRECEMCFSVTELGSTTFSAFTETINIYISIKKFLYLTRKRYILLTPCRHLFAYKNTAVVNNDMRVQEKMGTQHTLF